MAVFEVAVQVLPWTLKYTECQHRYFGRYQGLEKDGLSLAEADNICDESFERLWDETSKLGRIRTGNNEARPIQLG